MAGSFSHADRTAQREQARMQRALNVKVNKEPEPNPLFGPPVKVKRTHDPLRNEVQELLGSYEDVKNVIGQNTTKATQLIGVVPQPTTPLTTKVKGGNPFANVNKKLDGPTSATIVKTEKKPILNGQHQSKYGHQKADVGNVKKVKRENAGKTLGSCSHKPEGRAGVFDQFTNLDQVDTKLKDVSNSQNGPQSRDHANRERKDKSRGTSRDVKGEDIRSSGLTWKESHNQSRDRSKSKSDTKDEVHFSAGKTEAVTSENKFNGASSAASTPNSQKSTASSGYGSLNPTNSVPSQPHVSPVREHRDSDVSLKSTPSPDAPVFQSPNVPTNNSGKPHSTLSPLKPSAKLPNGLSKDVHKHRPTSEHSKVKGLKIDMPNQENEGKGLCMEKIFQEMNVEPLMTGIITPQKNVPFPFPATGKNPASQNLFSKHSKHDKISVQQPNLESQKSMGAPDGSTLLNDLNLSSDSDSENEEQVPTNNTRKPSASASMKRRASRSASRMPAGSSSSSSGSSSEGSDSESSSSDNEEPADTTRPVLCASPTIKADSPPQIQEEDSNSGKYALQNFFPKVAQGRDLLGPLSDSEQPEQPPSEYIADVADTDVNGDDDLLAKILSDKLPDPIAEHLESPPPPKLEPNLITPPSSVDPKIMDFGGPPSYKPPDTPPLSNKTTKQESSPVATTKSPVNSNSSKSSGRPSAVKSPRRGRPPKNKPKEDSSAQVSNSAISGSQDTGNKNKKSVSRQKSATKSKNASDPDKKKTLTSSGGKTKRGRPPKGKSPRYVTSSSSSESSDSSADNSSDEDDAWKPTVKSSPVSDKSAKESKSSNVLKRTSPGRALTPKKANITDSPAKRSQDLAVNASADSEIDLEEVFNATKFSPYADITAPEPMLSPLPNRDTTPYSRTTQMPKAATSPTRSPLSSSIHTTSKSKTSRKTSQSSADSKKLGVKYVNGNPSVMVRIDLSKLDKCPSRTQEPSGSDIDVDDNVDAFIKDGQSLLELKQMPSIVEPLPPSPAPRVHSDSISTNDSFSDGENKDDSDVDKSDSENEKSDSNNNEKEDVKEDAKSDSSSSSGGSSSDDSSSDEEHDDDDKKSVSESVCSEAKKEDTSTTKKEQAPTDNTESAAATPAPTTKKLTASGQKEVLSRIFNTNEKPLSSVKIPKKRPQSPSDKEDRKRARTDYNRHSDNGHRDRVNHKDDREWDRKHPPRLEEHSPRPPRNESPRPPRGTESPRPRERAGSTGSTSSRHSHYERDHRRGRNDNSSSRNRDRDRERDRDRDRHYNRDRDRNRSPWESRASRYPHWDAPPEDTDNGHVGTSPSPAHFNGQRSAAKDWSLLASGGSIAPAQDTKPRWEAPEPENEDGKPDIHLLEAKRLKHQADELEDRWAKSLMYVEAVLSFIRCGYAMEREKVSEPSKIFSMYKDTLSLLKHICKFRGSESNIPPHKERKLSVLSLRIQSMLYLKLFKLKKSDTGKLRRAIEDHNKSSTSAAQAPSPYQPNWNSRGTTGTPSPISPTPSPAGSVGSVGSVGSGNGAEHRQNPATGVSSSSSSTITVSQRIHSITQQYLVHMSNLYQCHDLWDQADAQIHHYQEFFDELDRLCGPLTLHSSILDLVRFVRCGVHMLKDT